MKYLISQPYINETSKKNVQQCLDTGWISSRGSFVTEFENSIASFMGRKFALAVSNGTVSLHLALKALDIRAGDEILVPDLCFAACASVILQIGCKPVFVSSSKNSWNMDLDDLRSKITISSKAIIAVHLYGIPLNMEGIGKIAGDNGLYVIEDCAQAFGAETNGKRTGGFGDIACFSFFANKIVSTGEGGSCVCDDENLYEKMRMLRDHGMSTTFRYWHEAPGFNYRMTNLQAAIGLGAMRDIEKILRDRDSIGKQYNEALAETPGLSFHPDLDYQAKTVEWLVSILVNEQKFGMSRNQLVRKLEDMGIESRPFFFPLSTMPPYKKYCQEASANTLNYARMGINLPTYVGLATEDISLICKAIMDSPTSNVHSKPDGGPQDTDLEPIPLFSEKTLYVSVILPCYNERKNITPLANEIILQLDMQGVSYEILVMDDDSPDKTADMVRESFKNNPNVKLTVRKKNRGLSNSIREGIEKAGGQYILVMDADFNHDPRYFPNLFQNCKSFDIVTGSRFVYGGGMYSPFRYYASLGFNLWIRILLKLQTQDNLSGYFIVSREALMKLNFEQIFKVYGEYFFHLLFLARQKRLKILETPVVYGERKYGDSKTNFIKTLLRYTLSAIFLKIKTMRQPVEPFLTKQKHQDRTEGPLK